MPSPFPGMDPFLEGSNWSTLHAAFCGEIARLLQPQLRPKYVARLNKWHAFDDEPIEVLSNIYPDVAVQLANQSGGAMAASVVAEAPLRMRNAVPRKVPQIRVEIRDVDDRCVVTVIELLSPANKHGRGRKQYLGKRERILLSATNLLEIDLLREGRRLPLKPELPDAPYFIVLSRAAQSPLGEVWPVQLEQPLPSVPVPLAGNDPDVSLNLQVALSSVYDTYGLDLDVDYSSLPAGPLTDTQREFVASVLSRRT